MKGETMKTPKITSILKGAAARAELTSKALAREIGMPYQTLQQRWRNPGSWKFYEWGAVLNVVPFMEEELLEIRKELMK